MNRKRYVVLDGEEDVQTLGKDQIFEVFGSYKTAEHRALQGATDKPGKTFTILESVAEVRCPLTAPSIRKL